MEETPGTGGEWMGQVNRRLNRLERRPAQGHAITELYMSGAFLMREAQVPASGWTVVAELTAPPGWVYVERSGAAG